MLSTTQKKRPPLRSRVGSSPAAVLEEKYPAEAAAEALLQSNRLVQTQQELQLAQKAYGLLATEHQQLQQLRRHEEREGYEVSELYRRQIVDKNKQLEVMKQELASIEERLSQNAATAAQREEQLQRDFAAERQQLGAAAAALQQQLDGRAGYLKEKEELEAEMYRLRKSNVTISEELGGKVRKLQRRLIELGYGVDGLGDGPQDDPHEEEEDSSLSLQADLHRILAHSRKMEGEMKQYGQEAEELQREMKALEGERAALLRDVRLKDEMETQYAQRGTLQAREIRDAHSKIGTLERGLAQMAADFEVEKTTLEQQLRGQLAAAADEQHGLRRLLRLRTRELRQLRRLAQEVLLQRSDVEAFLVSSIQQARAQMAKAAGAAAPGAGGWQPALAAVATAAGPPAAATPAAVPLLQAVPGEPDSSRAAAALLGSRAAEPGSAAATEGGVSAEQSRPRAGSVVTQPSTAHAGGPSPGAVDISDLSWEDRERILRLLFAKINKAAQQPSVAPAAPPTQPALEEEVEAPLPPLRGLATEAGPASLA